MPCGYALDNAGHDTRQIQDWLGHRSIKHTVHTISALLERLSAIERGACSTRREKFLKVGGGGVFALVW
jgi:type 1 fimbriae regulatory protein FimB